MKGLILAGGKGTRLRPITHTSAKQLVPIANKPILFYGIESIKAAGINDIGIITGDTEEEIKNAVGNGDRWGVKVTYIKQEAPLGLAHAVLTARDYLRDDSFVMYLGDNLIKDGIASLTAEFKKKKPNAQILLARVPNPEQFGVAELKENRVIRLEEKPKQPKSDYALVGVYMFDSTIFEAAQKIKPSKRGELEITDAIQYLVNKGFDVQSHVVNGWWKDTGKLADMLEANRMLLDTLEQRVDGTVKGNSHIEFKVVVEKGAKIENSTIRGPAIIGTNTKIIDSFIGPFTSINHNVTIEQSEIEHSIILEHSTIRNISPRIVDSLIGKNVTIQRSQLKPSALRFMLGDSSEVGIR